MSDKRTKRSKHQKLGSKFSVGGWSYSLLKRLGEIALYETRYPSSNKLQGYVVAIIKKYKGRTLPSGAILPDREEFPAPVILESTAGSSCRQAKRWHGNVLRTCSKKTKLAAKGKHDSRPARFGLLGSWPRYPRGSNQNAK